MSPDLIRFRSCASRWKLESVFATEDGQYGAVFSHREHPEWVVCEYGPTPSKAMHAAYCAIKDRYPAESQGTEDYWRIRRRSGSDAGQYLNSDIVYWDKGDPDSGVWWKAENPALGVEEMSYAGCDRWDAINKCTARCSERIAELYFADEEQQ